MGNKRVMTQRELIALFDIYNRDNKAQLKLFAQGVLEECLYMKEGDALTIAKRLEYMPSLYTLIEFLKEHNRYINRVERIGNSDLKLISSESEVLYTDKERKDIIANIIAGLESVGSDVNTDST